jgi:hypothetical protein
MFALVLAMDIFTYLLLTHILGRRIQPILVYQDGIRGYSSFYYSLVGLPGFIPAERIEQLSIEPKRTIVRVSNRCSQVRAGTSSGEWYLIAKINGKGYRIIGSGSPKRILQAAFKIELTLGIRAQRHGDVEELLGYITLKGLAVAPFSSEVVIDNTRPSGSLYFESVLIISFLIIALFFTIIDMGLFAIIFWIFPILSIATIFYRERTLRPSQLRLNPMGIELILHSGRKRFVPYGEIVLVLVNCGDSSKKSGRAQQGGGLDIGKNYLIFLSQEAALMLLRTILKRSPDWV